MCFVSIAMGLMLNYKAIKGVSYYVTMRDKGIELSLIRNSQNVPLDGLLASAHGLPGKQSLSL